MAKEPNGTENYLTTASFISSINKELKLVISSNPKKKLENEVDFIIRFERLNENFKKVCELIDIPYIKLPHRNKSVRKHYSHYYNEELIELVKNKYKEEIEFGNYAFEKP